MKYLASITGLLLLATTAFPASQNLPGTSLADMPADPSATMVGGIDRFLMAQLESALQSRPSRWGSSSSSADSHEKAMKPKRELLTQIIGAVDSRLHPKSLEYLSSTEDPALVAETPSVRFWSVRWPVFDGVWGEGLLLEPKTNLLGRVLVIPDADQTPEATAGLQPGLPSEGQYARRLAENGCQVLVLSLIDRSDAASGNERLKRFTNQPHREWIYRQAFQMGRHIIGYEVQKALSAVDWMESQGPIRGRRDIGILGHGEGGLIALHASALDGRITSTVVSGYFESRQRTWAEPIYRNVFGFLRDFGDAELAAMCAPRRLIIEHSEVQPVLGPPKARSGRLGGAAPGQWKTPEFASVSEELRRARSLVQESWAGNWTELVNGSEGTVVRAGSEKTLARMIEVLSGAPASLQPAGEAPVDRRKGFSSAARQTRQVAELVNHTQKILRASESVRDAFLFRKTSQHKADSWQTARNEWQTNLWNNVIGRLPAPSVPPSARSRLVYEEPKWTGYNVMLDVWPDVYAWGVLLLPKDLKPGERRPVVVCQHGLEGVPHDTISKNPKDGGFQYYKGFAAELAERGFVVFSPHNPYRGEDRFRVLQRKANLIGCSLFSVILAQHERILDWLESQPFVDSKRIGFYGLSYGGKTAMRVPALLDRYCLSICSADFNEWITKNATTDSGYSYMYTGEYEMPEFNLGNTFNYAEMAALIAPRPFMVERGHDDGVAPDEWVAHEFARVRRFYAKIGIPDRTEIEFFNGPHTINGKGTYRFLHEHLSWPIR
ncbi:MAG: hypothetical protein FJ405_04360 [Verrucomicrobia bacterium]|nr:hypothetical protein [Verrucomicrobiota bacterium]